MDVSLAGRTAVITGGSKGIGLAVATRFAASGADVAILARGREALDHAVRPSARTAGVSSASRATWRSPLTSSVPTRK
jgi:3-oxoacyl-[acyl-carrier protein] reductase